jgi:hypothetical protein
MRKIYNYQVFTIAQRSNVLEISDEDILALRQWKEHPFQGKTDSELVEYIAGLSDYLLDEMMDLENKVKTNTPPFAKTLYEQLYGDLLERTDLWSSLEKSGDSQLILSDEEGVELAKAESTM